MPSLHVSERDGKLLWKCHAGCSQEAVQDALIDRGLLPPRRNGHAGSHTAPVRTKQAPKAERAPLGRIVATYDYVDVTGELLFQTVRFEPKEFRQRRPNGNGRWIWSLGRIQPIIYRLPEVLAAETVHVVEGEKDVERLRTLGLTATTSPMGAGKWRPEMGAALAGKHVIVLPDADEPGRKHALDVAASAREHGAASIRIVELPKLAKGGDVSDWLDTGGDRAQLEELVRKTPLWGREQEGGDPGWRARLMEGERGPNANEANIKIALTAAPELTGKIRSNQLRSSIECRAMPWRPAPEWREFTDADEKCLTIWLQEQGLDVRDLRVRNAVLAVSDLNEYHPIRDYLKGLRWDGERRLDTWLASYLGAPAGSDEIGRITALFGAKWMIAAVARVSDPGCKVDTALILEGPQGEGKSSALEALFSKPFFADQISDLGGKDASQDIRGKWCIEFAELKNVRGHDVEKIKAFLSRSVDHYRPTYGRYSTDVPRQCVFAGSTNEDAYLHDATGNRRFWPVRTGILDVAAIRRDRDHLWAEAKHRYEQGEQWWLTKQDEKLARVVQEARVEEDAWADLIDNFLKDPSVNYIKLDEILKRALHIPEERWDNKIIGRVRRHLQKSHWTKRQMRFGGPRDRVWCRPESES